MEAVGKLHLRIRLIGRDAFDLAVAAVIVHAQIEHTERTIALPMVRGGRENVFAGIRNGADAHVDKRRARTAAKATITNVWKTFYEILSCGIVQCVPWIRVVAVRGARVCAVRICDPETTTDAILTVRIIPSRIDEHAVVVDGRIPFGSLEIAHRHDVRTVVPHGEKRVVAHFDVRIKATDIATAPFGNEGQTTVW